MIEFIFTKTSQKKLLILEADLKYRILNKLKILKNHPDIFSILTPMKDRQFATHRLRIGNYRLILLLKNQQLNNHEFLIVNLGHRREIYR